MRLNIFLEKLLTERMEKRCSITKNLFLVILKDNAVCKKDLYASEGFILRKKEGGTYVVLRGKVHSENVGSGLITNTEINDVRKTLSKFHMSLLATKCLGDYEFVALIKPKENTHWSNTCSRVC